MDSSNRNVDGSVVRDLVVKFSEDELIGLSNVVNEVLAWVSEADCETRIGLTVTELLAIQSTLNGRLVRMPSPK